MKTFLLVDDDANALRHLTQYLEDSLGSSEVHLAHTLQEGLAAAHSLEDLSGAVIDLVLPVGSGPSRYFLSREYHSRIVKDGGLIVAAVIRQRFPDVPVVIWSLDPLAEPTKEFVDAGEIVYFEKSRLFAAHSGLSSIIDALSRSPTTSTKVRDRLWRAAALQPNFMGLGIDLKALLDDDEQ